MSCYLVTNGHPGLLLAPAKLEMLDEETGLSFYHNVMTDSEIELFKELAAVQVSSDTALPDIELLRWL